jgi:hypothetical protein
VSTGRARVRREIQCTLALALMAACSSGPAGPPGTQPTPTATANPTATPADASLKADCGRPRGYGPVFGGRPITFDGRGSTTPHPPIASYNWDFGDGTQGIGPTPTHVYVKGDRFGPYEMTFTVTLQIVDAAGDRSTCQTTCFVTHLY